MIHEGDALTQLKKLPKGRWRTCVTSPPYYALRNYDDTEGQIGLEDSPHDYLARLIEVFREVRRVLAADGTLWLNIGDTYASNGGSGFSGKNAWCYDRQATTKGVRERRWARPPEGIKAKCLYGVPWRLAFALQDDGWYLRQDIIWSKPNPMPESVKDRCTKSHEYLFLLSNSKHYYFDAKAIREPARYAGPNGAQHSPYGQGFTRRSQAAARNPEPAGWDTGKGAHGNIHKHGRRRAKKRTVRPGVDTRGGGQGNGEMVYDELTRNKRSVWEIATQPFSEAHFATFPVGLALPCILAGSAKGDVVGDPFAGSGTVGVACKMTMRHFEGVELNPAYVKMARRRIRGANPHTGRTPRKRKKKENTTP